MQFDGLSRFKKYQASVICCMYGRVFVLIYREGHKLVCLAKGYFYLPSYELLHVGCLLNEYSKKSGSETEITMQGLKVCHIPCQNPFLPTSASNMTFIKYRDPETGWQSAKYRVKGRATDREETLQQFSSAVFLLLSHFLCQPECFIRAEDHNPVIKMSCISIMEWLCNLILKMFYQTSKQYGVNACVVCVRVYAHARMCVCMLGAGG